jgi:hypothetical protein
MFSLQKIEAFVLLVSLGCSVVCNYIAARLVDSPERVAPDSPSVFLGKKGARSPAPIWVVRRNRAVALAALSGLGFGIALNFVP